MSRTLFSTGLIVPLKTPLTGQQIKAACEALDDANSFLAVNHEGTLLFCDFVAEEDPGISIISPVHIKKFTEEIKRLNMNCDFTKMSLYSCAWYNSNNSYISNIEIGEYLHKFVDNN